jgi:hypothetical protein
MATSFQVCNNINHLKLKLRTLQLLGVSSLVWNYNLSRGHLAHHQRTFIHFHVVKLRFGHCSLEIAEQFFKLFKCSLYYAYDYTIARISLSQIS